MSKSLAKAEALRLKKADMPCDHGHICRDKRYCTDCGADCTEILRDRAEAEAESRADEMRVS